jgi:hypothetical protein
MPELSGEPDRVLSRGEETEVCGLFLSQRLDGCNQGKLKELAAMLKAIHVEEDGKSKTAREKAAQIVERLRVMKLSMPERIGKSLPVKSAKATKLEISAIEHQHSITLMRSPAIHRRAYGRACAHTRRHGDSSRLAGSRFGYTSISLATHNLTLFTDDAAELRR